MDGVLFMSPLFERPALLARRKFAGAIGAMVVCAVLPGFAEPLPLGDVLACEMETYLVLDRRDTLAGKWIPRKNAAAQAALSSAAIRELRMRLEPLSPGARSQETRLEVMAQQIKQELPFTIPLRDLRGGYYRLHGELVAKDDVRPCSTTKRRSRSRCDNCGYRRHLCAREVRVTTSRS
jgi:hypothetical protein